VTRRAHRGARRKGTRRRSGLIAGPRLVLAAVAAAASLAVVAAVLASVRHADAAGQQTPRAEAGPTAGAPGQPARVRHGKASADGSAAARQHGITTGHGRRRPSNSLVPASGAYLGAYVQPASYTSAGQIDAIVGFERQLGRSLGLVHVYHPWDSPFPSAADQHFVRRRKALLLTWGGTPDTRAIIAGRYDALIRQRAAAVKGLGRPILMEFRHEMDRPNLQWAVHGPKAFIAAWDHIRAIFSQVGASNVGWVWCPTGWGFEKGRAQAFYPGNNEVDWVCADIYSASTRQPLQVAAQPFLRWAKGTGKPIMIGEFAANGSTSAWSSWLLAAGELAGTDKQIKGMAYFDANGTDSQGRPFQYWLGGNGTALRAFGQMLSWRAFHPVLPSSQ